MRVKIRSRIFVCSEIALEFQHTRALSGHTDSSLREKKRGRDFSPTPRLILSLSAILIARNRFSALCTPRIKNVTK